MPTDLSLYTRSFHQAANTLAKSLEAASSPASLHDMAPVVVTYRYAVELQLKAIVLGAGGNFLATQPDMLSAHKTHSVHWLGQFLSQIITALHWEDRFQCEGIESLSDFKALLEEVREVDPGAFIIRLPVRPDGQDPGLDVGKHTIAEFARRMDSLLTLLESTADALAAEWHTRSERAAIEEAWNRGNSRSPIQ